MSKSINNFCRLAASVFCLILLLNMCVFAQQSDVDARLESGRKAFNERNFNVALDDFVYVLMHGTGDQKKEANEYLNMMHYAQGSMDVPQKMVYDANAGSHFGQPLAQPAGQPVDSAGISAPPPQVQSAVDMYESYKTMSVAAPAEAPLEGYQAYAPESVYAPQPVTVSAADDYSSYKALSEPGPAVSASVLQPAYPPFTASEEGYQTLSSEYAEYAPPPSASVAAPGYTTATVLPYERYERFASARPAELQQFRDAESAKEIAAMKSYLIERVKSHNGVNVYMRGGQVDAIDIKPDVLFTADNNFKPSAQPVLNDIYALMLVHAQPSFVLLPEGSYTDDVDIRAVRQALALNSYLINRGLSSAKISFQMGLTTQEPPAQFANLDGMGIVFDYNAAPNLTRKAADADTPPILSLGTYPFEEINVSRGEGMVIDFSVIEASAKVSEWTLEIAHHNKDGKQYIVRRVMGTGPVYEQVFWNGRKQFFGESLPLGRYTIVLTATDNQGRQKTVRRGVTLTGTARTAPVQPAQAAPKAKQTKGLNYKASRLWKQPGRVQKEAAAAVAEPQEQEETPAQEEPYDPYAPQYNAPVLPSGYGADSAGQGNDDNVNTPYPAQAPQDEDYYDY